MRFPAQPIEHAVVIVVLALPTVIHDVAAVDRERRRIHALHLFEHRAALGYVAHEGDMGVAEIGEVATLLRRGPGAPGQKRQRAKYGACAQYVSTGEKRPRHLL